MCARPPPARRDRARGRDPVPGWPGTPPRRGAWSRARAGRAHPWGFSAGFDRDPSGGEGGALARAHVPRQSSAVAFTVVGAGRIGRVLADRARRAGNGGVLVTREESRAAVAGR